MDNYNFTKGKWYVDTENGSNNIISSEQSIGIKSEVDDLTWDICAVWTDCGFDDKESKANALLISKAPEMLDMLDELCENLAFQLDRLGVCGQGDGKGRKADTDSYGGTELLERAKQLIKEVTEIK